MLVKYLRKDSTQILLVILLVAVGIWFKNLAGVVTPSEVNEIEYGTPIEVLINQFNILFPAISVWVGFAVMALLMFMIHSLNNQYIFIPQRSLLPLFLFIILGFSCLSVQHLTPALAALPFLLLTMNYMFGSYRKDYAEAEFFQLGFYFALASVIYLPALSLSFAVIFAVLVLRTFSWREWLSMIVGFILPFVFVEAYVLFSSNADLNSITGLEFFKLTPAVPYKISSFFGYGYLVSIGLAFLSGCVYLVGWAATQKVRTSKIYMVFFVLVVNVIVSFLLVPYTSKEIFVIAAIPASYIIGVYMIFVRRTFFADALLLFMLLFALSLQVFPE